MKFFADLQKYGADEVSMNYFLSHILFFYVMSDCDYRCIMTMQLSNTVDFSAI